MHLQTSVIIDEREFPGLGEVKRSPPPSSSSKAGSKSKSATAESSKVKVFTFSRIIKNPVKM